MNGPQGAIVPADRNRRMIGWALWGIGMLIGAVILGYHFILAPVMMGLNKAFTIWFSMGIAACLAIPAVLFYMLVPILVDRYDPEPVWALAMVFFWGAIAACGFSIVINTAMSDIGKMIGGARNGAQMADIFGAVISAPITEEFFKGLALVAMLVFFKREFDGVVDGVIYATFVALGFAAFENIIYYARGGMSAGLGGLVGTFIIRGLFSPWCHPVFTSMTGIGFGIARETNKGWVKFAAPFGGYIAAVLLHMTWNGVPTLAGVFLGSKASGTALLAMYLLFWLPFVTIFFIIVIFLVRREGQIIRKFLEDEVLIGNLTRDELELVCSPIGRIKAFFGRGGMKGRHFVDAASRLALSKWHATRAQEGRKMTISADFIVPLRQELAKTRMEIQQGAR